MGVDLNTVRELLGYADMKMTLRYAPLAPAVKKTAVELLKHKTRRPAEGADKMNSIQLFEDKRIRTAWDKEKQECFFPLSMS